MELDALPDHLLIVGGGYIALEFGQMFRRFGSDVTIVQHHPRLLMREDDDVSDAVAAILRDEGITVLTGASARRVERDDDGRVRLTVRTPDGERRVSGSHLLAATGRVPNTEELAPEAAGIQLDENGHIRVDGRLETSAPGVYAMGDAKGVPPSRTSRTTTSASYEPTCSRMAAPAPTTASCPTRSSPTPNWRASG